MMSDIRQLVLTDKVGYVNTDVLPAAGGCNLLCMSDRQLAIIRGHLFPMVRWPTRWVKPLYGDVYQTDPDALSDCADEVDDLEDQVCGGNTMACEQIADAIESLAAAIAASGTGGVNVVCGTGGSISRYSPLAGALDTLEAQDFVPAQDIEEPDPEGDPPEGFETWEEYYTYKCKAAHWLADVLITGIENLGGLSLAGIATNLATGAIVAAVGLLATAVAPATIIGVVGICVQLALLDAAANTVLKQVAASLRARRQEIICAMYASGSAADVVSAVTAIVDDAIEAIIYYGPLAALAEPIAALTTTLLTYVTDLGLARALFEVTTDVGYLGEDCSSCVTGELIQNGSFDTSAYHWFDYTGDPVPDAYDYPDYSSWWDAGKLHLCYRGLDNATAYQIISVATEGDYLVSGAIERYPTWNGVANLKVDGGNCVQWTAGQSGEKNALKALAVGPHTVSLEASYEGQVENYCKYDDISVLPYVP